MDLKPYTRTLQDELDWKLLDQLHAAVAQISSFCFETKKFCVTTDVLVLTLMVKFTDDRLDHSIFVAALVIPACFWFLDAVAYFYQVKLRGMMNAIRSRIESRGASPLFTPAGVPVIASDRVDVGPVRLAFNAGFNHSMWLYAILIASAAAAWGLYAGGLIS